MVVSFGRFSIRYIFRSGGHLVGVDFIVLAINHIVAFNHLSTSLVRAVCSYTRAKYWAAAWASSRAEHRSVGAF